jgi:BirA family biotin operon repressor/biotin-[acetyl-CoA-carboxylase] ligase
LISRISEAEFVSGQALATEFNVSRATISSWMAQLDSFGLQINKVQGRGYRLQSPVKLLNKELIVDYLGMESAQRFNVINIVAETASTNQIAMQSNYPDERWHLNATEYQSAGKGRRGKVWQSPFGASLLFTLGMKRHWAADVLYLASLLAGLALAEVISKRVVEDALVQVKWPNDLYINGQKLAGILCELQGSPVDEALLVVGIGINIFSKPTDVDNPAAMLDDYAVTPIDRNELLAEISRKIVNQFERAQSGELTMLIHEWQRYDYLKNREVKVHLGERVVFGVASGINSRGELVLRLADGSNRSFNGGEVTVRW